MAVYNLTKTVYDKREYNNTVDTSINLPAPPPALTDAISVSEFFNLYRAIFYNIPTQGETDSHEYLVKLSSNYIGASANNEETQLLIDEINSLRESLTKLNSSMLTPNTSSNTSL